MAIDKGIRITSYNVCYTKLLREHVMDYALNVAHRLQYNILAVHVDTLPLFGDRGKRNKLFTSAMRESERIFQAKAQSQGA